MEQRCEHKLAKPRTGASKTHRKAESPAEKVVDDIHCREVHQAKAEASEYADGEVEDDDAGGSGDLDIEGGEEEANGGKDDSS